MRKQKGGKPLELGGVWSSGSRKRMAELEKLEEAFFGSKRHDCTQLCLSLSKGREI